MKFASWTYDGYQVNLINSGNTTDLTNYVANGEWDLVEARVERNVVFYSCCQEPYPDVTYTFVLRRRPLFYGKSPAFENSYFIYPYSFQSHTSLRADNWYCFDELLYAIGFRRKGIFCSNCGYG